MKVLNALENAILNYGRDHVDFVSNPYQYFAEKLGYKSKNYIYRWFQNRDNTKIGLVDLMLICKITGDIRPLECFYKDAIKEIRKINKE